MPLETAQHIHGLDKTWPLHNDPHSQGDDHLRLIKSVLLEDLGSLQGPLTLTADEINGLVQKVADVLPLAGGIMSGDIRMSSGSGVSFTLSDATNDFAKISSSIDKILIEILDPADGTTVLKTVTIGPDGIEGETPDGSNPKQLVTVDYVSHKTAILRDVKAQGVNAGDFVQGDWRIRELNDIHVDDIGITLAFNQVTLPAGSYTVEASAPGHGCGGHVLAWANVGLGSYRRGPNAFSRDHSESHARLSYNFVVTEDDVTNRNDIFELHHQCSLTNVDDGLGSATGFISEVYAEVILRKI